MELTPMDVILNGIRATMPDDTKIDPQEVKILKEKDDRRECGKNSQK